MSYNSGMPVSSYNDEMKGYGRHDYRDDDGRYGPPPDFIDRNYRPYPRDQGQRRDFDYNHGLNMPPKHGHENPPFGYGPLPNAESYNRQPGPYSHHGPPNCGPEIYDGPPGPGRYSDHHGHNKHCDPDYYYGPNGPDMHHGPPGPGMHNGPDMHHGQSGPSMHNGPNMHHGPPGPNMRNGPDMHHGPPGPNVHNGPNMHHRPPGPNILDRPNLHPGPPGPNMHNGPHNADMFHGPPGPEGCNGFLGSDVARGPQGPNRYQGPPVSDMCQGPLGSEIHRVPPPGSNIPFGPPLPNFHVPPGPGIHQGPPNSDIPPPLPGPRPGPDIRMGPPPPGPDIRMGPPPPGPDIHLGPPPPGPDICLGPPPGPDIRLGPPPGPLHHVPHVPPSRPIHETPHGPHHLSPLYPSIPSSAQPITVPPPQCFPSVSVPVTSSQTFSSENSSHPPLPPSPPRECRPPTPPSPCPPSPHPPSPRPPSPSSSLFTSQRVDAYDPAEALFSPTSSNSPELSEKQEESIIKKYVKGVQKLKSSSSTGHTAKFTGNIKPVRKTPEPKKIEGDKPSILEESPTRPNLDARLKLMFGTTTESESPKKKEKKKSPAKPSRSKKGETKEIDRPLSPPPSPFQSRQMYHYWHKVTLKLRKSFSASSIDFVSANSTANIQSSHDVKSHGKVNAVNIPPKPAGLPLPKRLPTVPPPNYKTNISEQIHSKENSLKSDSASRNIHRMHPYKIGVSKGHIVQSSLDSELEIACDITPEDGMSDGDLKNNANDICGVGKSQFLPNDERTVGNGEPCPSDDDFEMQDEIDSDIGSETISIVLSKIIDELRNEIQKEVYGSVIDTEIKKFIEKHKS